MVQSFEIGLHDVWSIPLALSLVTSEDRSTSAVVDHEFLAGRLGTWTHGGDALFRGLADRVAELVAAGELRSGDRLPAERALAQTLRVSRGTVVAAYDLLRERDVVVRRQGSGTRVVGVTSPAPSGRATSDPLFDETADAIDLLKAQPLVSPLVRELVAEPRFSTDPNLLNQDDPAGLPGLRAALAEQYTREGLPTTPDQILVTSGAQQAMALAVGLLTGTGDNVLTEWLTWPGLTDLIRHRGARLHPVPMGLHGVDLDELASAVDRLRPALIALNPHHHNPTGTRVPAAGRRRLADLSADHQLPLLEDRVAARLAFDGNVPPPLAALRPDGPLITVDSLSKTAWGGLRIGWVRADPVLVQRLRSLRATHDLSSPVPSQLLAEQVLADLPRVVADRVRELADKERLLAGLVAARLPDWQAVRPAGGMSLWAKLPEPVSTPFSSFAVRFGVSIAGGREFSTGTTTVHDRIRLPFCLGEQALTEGVTRVARAWAAFQELGPTARHATSNTVLAS